jgi:hypothetical protein
VFVFVFVVMNVLSFCHPLSSSALAALHHHKRIRRDDTIHHREAEKLLLKAIARDDLYSPAYLSLASLYIYRMKQPDKALRFLHLAKDRGLLDNMQIEALILDAQALAEGGNEHMLTVGAVLAEQDYLAALANEPNLWFQTQAGKAKNTHKATTTTTTTKEKVS